MAKKKIAKKKSKGKSVKKATKKNKPDAKRGKPKAAKKKAAKKKASEKSAKKKPGKKQSLDPKPVKSGKGPTPGEVGAAVVEMVRAGAPEEEIWAKWFSPKLVSIEGGMGQAWHGRKAVKAKAAWWYGAHKVHSIEADGPFVGATGFGVRYTIDAEEIESGNRFKGDELAFYTVKNGKVIQEEFMGRPMPKGECHEAGAEAPAEARPEPQPEG